MLVPFISQLLHCTLPSFLCKRSALKTAIQFFSSTLKFLTFSFFLYLYYPISLFNKSAMQILTPPRFISSAASNFFFNSPPFHLNSSLSFPFKPHQLTTLNFPCSLNLPSKKLLCKPPSGKHVREDYLVVICLYIKKELVF